MKSILSFLLLISISVCLFTSCEGDTEPMEIFTDSFDREAMLTGWADEIIIPSLENYMASLQQLSSSTEVFVDAPTDLHLTELRASYIVAYRAWQRVAMYNIGKAEEIGLLNFTNVYPTDVESIDENIITQDYNFSLPSSYDEQGFPALDYMLYGIRDNEEEIIAALSEVGARNYIADLVSNLNRLTEMVLNDWKSDYRTIFISNSGSSATASVDKVVNDFLFYYERYFRAGKIGIPAGVFSGSPIATAVEAPYAGISKELFVEAFDAVRDFFNGRVGVDSKVISLDDYLMQISEQNQSTDIASVINDQWNLTAETLEVLSDNFEIQILEDNSRMLRTYDELQVAVILLKVDMLQALNIQVDFVDADGD